MRTAPPALLLLSVVPPYAHSIDSIEARGHPRLLFDASGREAIRERLRTDPVHHGWLRRFTQSLESDLHRVSNGWMRGNGLDIALRAAAAYTFTGEDPYCDTARVWLDTPETMLTPHNDYMCTALDTGAGTRSVVPYVVDWCHDVWVKTNATWVDWMHRNLYWQIYGYVQPRNTVGTCGGVGRGAPACPYGPECAAAPPPSFGDPCDMSHEVRNIWPPLLLNYLVVDGYEGGSPEGNDTASVAAAAFGPRLYLDFYNRSMHATQRNGIACPWNPTNATAGLPPECPSRPWATNVVQWMWREFGAPGESPAGAGVGASGLDRQVKMWADLGPLMVAGKRLLGVDASEEVPAAALGAAYPLLAAIGAEYHTDFGFDPLPMQESLRGRPWVPSQVFGLQLGPEDWRGGLKWLYRRLRNATHGDRHGWYDCASPMPRARSGGEHHDFGPDCPDNCTHSTTDGPCYGCKLDDSAYCGFADVWTLLFYPSDAELAEQDPVEAWGRAHWDARMGSLVLRSGYTQDFARDVILQTMSPAQRYWGFAQRSAKALPVTAWGTHPPDVNTFRLAGLGGIWARAAPVQATGDTRHNAVGYWTGNNSLLFTNSTHLPHRMLGDCPHGSVVKPPVVTAAGGYSVLRGSCADVRNHTRRVFGDFSGRGGSPAVVAVADSSANGGLWRMVTDPANAASLASPSAFRITAPSNATLRGDVLWPRDAALRVGQVCTNDHHRKPPLICSPTIDVESKGTDQQEYLIVMTLAPPGAESPEVATVSGAGCCGEHAFRVGSWRVTVSGDDFLTN